MESIVIDNCLISKFMGNGICITPIGLAKKKNPHLNIDSLQKITYGSRKKDNSVISKLATGELNYDDVATGNHN
jgi:hypothetical protein